MIKRIVSNILDLTIRALGNIKKMHRVTRQNDCTQWFLKLSNPYLFFFRSVYSVYFNT